MLVAPHIVNDVSYVTRIKDATLFTWQAQYLVMSECHFSWQAQHWVILECHFSWQAQYLVMSGRQRISSSQTRFLSNKTV